MYAVIEVTFDFSIEDYGVRRCLHSTAKTPYTCTSCMFSSILGHWHLNFSPLDSLSHFFFGRNEASFSKLSAFRFLWQQCWTFAPDVCLLLLIALSSKSARGYKFPSTLNEVSDWRLWLAPSVATKFGANSRPCCVAHQISTVDTFVFDATWHGESIRKCPVFFRSILALFTNHMLAQKLKNSDRVT